MKSSSEAAGAYLVAVYHEDVDDILDLVPDEVLKQILKDYNISKKQLKESMKHELKYEIDNYPHCDSIKSMEIRPKHISTRNILTDG